MPAVGASGRPARSSPRQSHLRPVCLPAADRRRQSALRFPGGVGRNKYGSSYYLPGIENGKWQYINMDGRCHDKEQFNEFKSKVYKLWDWDPDTGWPKRSGLEAQGLKSVANELEKHGKLGAEDRSLTEQGVT